MTQSGGNSIEIPHFAPYQFQGMPVSKLLAGSESNRDSHESSMAFEEHPSEGHYLAVPEWMNTAGVAGPLPAIESKTIQGEDRRDGYQVSRGTRDESWRFRNAHAPLTSTTRIKPAELCKLPGFSVSLGLRAAPSVSYRCGEPHGLDAGASRRDKSAPAK